MVDLCKNITHPIMYNSRNLCTFSLMQLAAVPQQVLSVVVANIQRIEHSVKQEEARSAYACTVRTRVVKASS